MKLTRATAIMIDPADPATERSGDLELPGPSTEVLDVTGCVVTPGLAG